MDFWKKKTHNYLKIIWEMPCFRYEIKLVYMMYLWLQILTEVVDMWILEKVLKYDFLK